MNRNEFHQQARILQGDDYNGQLINELIDRVERAEKQHTRPRSNDFQAKVTASEAFYRSRGWYAATPSTPATSRYEADNCEHCHAAYGHKASCPLINRNVAEARSAFSNPSEADRIHAHALGVIL